MCVATYIVTNTTLPCKAKCSVFIYSLLVQIMYIIVNKVMFNVVEIISPYIKNNINRINTTSLSHNKSLCSKVATLTSAFLLISYVKYYTISLFLFQANITFFYYKIYFVTFLYIIINFLVTYKLNN